MNYKKITINFNLDNPKDKVIYEYLMDKGYKTAYLKNLIMKEIKNNGMEM